MLTLDGDMMRQAIGFPCGPVARERKDGALSDEMRGGSVLVQIGKDRRKRFARMQLLRGLWIFGVHEYHEMRVCRKERHLAFRVAAIGAVSVSLDKLAYGQAVRGLLGGDADVFAHQH